jgi:hypothetical protein
MAQRSSKPADAGQKSAASPLRFAHPYFVTTPPRQRTLPELILAGGLGEAVRILPQALRATRVRSSAQQYFLPLAVDLRPLRLSKLLHQPSRGPNGLDTPCAGATIGAHELREEPADG